MGDRTIQLLTKFIEIQNYLMKMYKNTSNIQGQYDTKIKTCSKVMVQQYNKKMTIYDEMIRIAAEKDDDTTTEDFPIIYDMLVERQNKNKLVRINGYADVVELAYENSLDVVHMVDKILLMIEEKQLKHHNLKNVLMKIREIEQKDSKALKHIIDTNSPCDNREVISKDSSE